MVRFFRENPNCRVAVVEKTDRLYPNFRDRVTLEDLDVEIHLPKEGQVISKDAKSQAKLVHGIQVVVARNTYRKPFDMIFLRAKNEEWRALRDDFRTLLPDCPATWPKLSAFGS